MAKILLLGDAGIETGFGRANGELGKRLVLNHGHDVSALAVNFRGDHADTPMHLYPADIERTGDGYGKKRIIEMLGRIEPDLVWITNDPFIVRTLLWNNEYDKDHWLLKLRPVVAYMPIDGSPYPQTWDDGLAQYTRRVAMSRFGAEAMGVSDMVYHGVDTEVFHSVSREHPIHYGEHHITSKREAKIAYGYPPDAFLVLRVDANSMRKDYAATWKALVPVMERHSDIWVHFHCTEQPIDGGVSMLALWSRNLKTAPRFRLSDDITTLRGIDKEALAILINAADLFVSTSRGEGFGLTLAEAAACGVPVIAQNISSIPEVVGPGGVLIEPAYSITAPGGQEHAAADIAGFSAAIEHLYLNDGFRKRYGRAATAHVRKTFNWDVEAAKLDAIISDTIAQTELVPVSA